MKIEVDGLGGAAYRVSLGRHEVVVDQPATAGGEDRGPTPTDLFVAGLAACAAYYAGRFLQRRGVANREVHVGCDFEISKQAPARVEWINLALALPPGLPEDVRTAALRAAEHCTVHNSLDAPPVVRLDLTPAEAAA